ncbi:threonine-phosphate decarboxylase [Sphingopyxis panaciterrulae]|uniref:Cobalamin biosynthetic protein CobC n=1 Tax=Sphingopyxis panaciterrulae TaxID=462372 RepID=A0A7W9B8G6_9SPHN|nr:threonine-phosphate decarboxylase [Sphingopyxis panaciterrulae]MBB5707977.1 cobalamin biosynthetic protein CobC [Sphingopyxis panaciterrulae]
MSEPWTWHGGGLSAAKHRFGTGSESWIDLSTGINPNPWPDADGVEIDWGRLPEHDAIAGLEAVAAAYFGVAAHQVCVVPGTEIGLRLVGALLGGEARYAAPGYRTHGEMISGAMATDPDGIERHGGSIILANPNNPDGRIVPPAMLRELLASRGGTGWLLVDEAFADFDPALSIAPAVNDDARLILFRSFGKFFGLAGVRLGFVLGPGPVLHDLRALLGAWPVSTAAVAIGTAAYADADWIAATRRRLPGQAAALDALLREAGYAPVGACPLFRLVETTDARALFERLARHAILTRPFTDEPQWLRFGLPTDEAALPRLKAALSDG